jgi:hypothetical protein
VADWTVSRKEDAGGVGELEAVVMIVSELPDSVKALIVRDILPKDFSCDPGDIKMLVTDSGLGVKSPVRFAFRFERVPVLPTSDVFRWQKSGDDRMRRLALPATPSPPLHDVILYRHRLQSGVSYWVGWEDRMVTDEDAVGFGFRYADGTSPRMRERVVFWTTDAGD